MAHENGRTTRSSNRGKIAIFIDGNNLFHAARSVGVEIDYAKLLDVLRSEDQLLRAFFYTGVDQQAERQQGFLLWMRRNGYRVVEKELKLFADGTKKANLDVEIAVDMLSLADKYDTAILVSGDEDFAYAVNAVAYKGARVEIAGFRSNTSPRLIDVADRFIELDALVAEISKGDRFSTGNLHRRSGADWPPIERPYTSSGTHTGPLRSGDWNGTGSTSSLTSPRPEWHGDRSPLEMNPEILPEEHSTPPEIHPASRAITASPNDPDPGPVILSTDSK
ncbi:MAG: NYN domain-containing protein [Blastocatellia bacterium]|nr:NYN domain-containing protein [Blastocatellia bacterium]